MKYSKLDIQSVESNADIRDIIPGLKGTGAQRYCTCPNCGKSGKDKGLLAWHKKNGAQYINGAKCYACGFSISGAIDAYMYINKVDFLAAVEQLAADYNVHISPMLDRNQSQSQKDFSKHSFCEMQLYASGLTLDDVKVRVPIKGTSDFKFESPFRKGGADVGLRNFNSFDDEMLIFYYDLDGNPLKFTPKGKNKVQEYIRVRWSNPALHLDQEGKEIKYQTSKGANTVFYIPEFIRNAYRKSETIETLVIQEGEKKAEKACKHGIPSLGIQGIYNIGNAEAGLIKELQYIVKKCSVKNVVLLMDSDWDHLSKNLEPGCRIDQRPNQFAKAVIKFKTYVQTLHKLGIFVDVFFGHINQNSKNEKGIDDLLVGTLHLKEKLLAEDFKNAMLSHNGIGEFVSVHKISSTTDFQIQDFWHLNSRKDFFDKYADQIKGLVTFRFSGISYVVENGNIKETERGTEDQFWSVSVSDKDKKSIEFDYTAALKFLEANSFYKIHTVDQRTGEFKFIHAPDFVVSEISDINIRNFVLKYVRTCTKDKFVLNSFIPKLPSWLGPNVLESLKELDDKFYSFEPNKQSFFFRNCRIDISADSIESSDILDYVWKENVIDRKFTRVPIIEFHDDDAGNPSMSFTEQGMKSDFVQFIICTSNFWKGKEHLMSDEDRANQCLHLINKITSIGYLLNSWKPRSEQICIVAMDAKMDEVGSSNGRSGKSLIGQALMKIINGQTIDCKKLKNDDDFIYSLVTPKTKLVFLDDTRVNFDFENFYSALTGDLQINPKQGGRFEIKYDFAPKFFITTNHSLNDQSDSGKDRRVMMSFSNFFNKSFTPTAHFGHMLFDEWDYDQWNLFDNFMMECVMVYLRSMKLGWSAEGKGVIHPPMEQLERRELRQIMGEAFYTWADTFFDPSYSKLNYRWRRKELFDEYHREFPSAKETIRPHDFKKRFIAFCRFKGYHFNPDSLSEDGLKFSQWHSDRKTDIFIGKGIKSNGVEYWRITTDEYAKAQPW